MRSEPPLRRLSPPRRARQQIATYTRVCRSLQPHLAERKRASFSGRRRSRAAGSQEAEQQEAKKQSTAMRRPPSKGRQRIEIKPIADKAAREVTCSKRKGGLFKKASELALLCGAHVAAIVFSNGGKVFAFGSPSVDAVIRGEEAAPYPDDDGDLAAVEATRRQVDETRALVEAEKARLAAVGEKVLRALLPGKKFWWEADVEQLGEAELPEFTKALHRFRENVQRHANKLRSDAPPTPLLLQ